MFKLVFDYLSNGFVLPGTVSHTAMTGDPIVAAGGKINPTLCMPRVTHLATLRFRGLRPL